MSLEGIETLFSVDRESGFELLVVISLEGIETFHPTPSLKQFDKVFISP